eukprot:TRINITY_DN9899_c0_g1_i1.p1 TRINITY_DN9899_c0_g1~~TRINITY_DN9899_c0_g1_i1.p1  ORF type:complete len:140 (+),score=25.70 TRINITY_DN9899_c0_g1_i1:151-570(+)
MCIRDRDRVAHLYPRLIAGVFLTIALTMSIAPQFNLSQDGIDFDGLTVAGRAEVRAYYVGTAMCVSLVCLCAPKRTALQAIAVVLGGFAASRVLSYALDGVDTDAGFRLHQHAVFGMEILGCATALVLLQVARPELKRE